MVTLAFSTNAYTEHPLLEAVERIRDQGYDAAEILADEPHAYFPTFGEADRNDLVTRLDELDLAVSNVNANTTTGYYDDAPPSSFFEPSVVRADEEARQWRVDYTKRAVDLAEATDSPAICLASGRPLPGTFPEEAREYLIESLTEILDYAEPRDVDVGIEFEPELLIESTAEVLDLADEIGRDSLGVNLDVGHAAVYGEDVVEAIHDASGRITGLHVEDIVGGRRGKHYHRIPGEGDLDFRRMFDALDDVGYDGYATFELYTYPDEPDRAAREAREAVAEYV